MRDVNLKKPGPLAYALSGAAVWMFGQQLWAEYIQSKRERNEMKLGRIHHQRDLEGMAFRAKLGEKILDEEDPWATLEAQESEILELKRRGRELEEENESLAGQLYDAGLHLAKHHEADAAGSRGFLIQASTPEEATEKFETLIKGLTKDLQEGRGDPEVPKDRPTPENIGDQVKGAFEKARARREGSAFPGAHSDEDVYDWEKDPHPGDPLHGGQRSPE